MNGPRQDETREVWVKRCWEANHAAGWDADKALAKVSGTQFDEEKFRQRAREITDAIRFENRILLRLIEAYSQRLRVKNAYLNSLAKPEFTVPFDCGL